MPKGLCAPRRLLWQSLPHLYFTCCAFCPHTRRSDIEASYCEISARISCFSFQFSSKHCSVACLVIKQLKMILINLFITEDGGGKAKDSPIAIITAQNWKRRALVDRTGELSSCRASNSTGNIFKLIKCNCRGIRSRNKKLPA